MSEEERALKESHIAIAMRDMPERPNTDDEDTSTFTKAIRGVVIGFVVTMSVLLFPITMFLSIKVVKQYEKAVLFHLGKLSSPNPKPPGLFITIPLLDSTIIVDMRTQTYNIPRQEILTKDSVTMEVDAVLFSKVFNPVWSVIRIEDIKNSTVMLAATTLRNIAATTTLSEFLTNRDHVSREMQSILDNVTDDWGLRIERVEITDVRLPPQMQRAMAAEAEADREARAKIISSRGEQQASEALREAADSISQNPAAIQLRYLQTLNTISAEGNSTIIFPFPMEFMKSFLQKTP